MGTETSLITELLLLSGVGISAALIAAVMLFRIMFTTFGGFIENVKYWLSCDYHQRNEMFSEQWWAETKLFIWIIVSYAIGIGADQLFGKGV